MMTQRVLTETQAAEYTGLSRSTFRQGRMAGVRDKRCPPPPYIKLGRAIRYLQDDLDDWLKANRKIPVTNSK